MLKSIWGEQLPHSEWGAIGKCSCLKQANPVSSACPFKERGSCKYSCVGFLLCLTIIVDHQASDKTISETRIHHN